MMTSDQEYPVLSQPIDLEKYREYQRRLQWYYRTLYDCRTEFGRDVRHDDDCTFKDWMLETYGIGIVFDGDGNTKGDYDIVDEQKYVVFLLKYA